MIVEGPVDQIRREIREHNTNRELLALGYGPVFTASATARVIIIGQAPGIRAQTSGTVWNDASGERLIQWLGITEEAFRNPALISHLPMDFYYPGKGKSGDLPPRKDFAPTWHPQIMRHMPDVRLTLLIGSYAQNYYLGSARKATLTETVRNYEAYVPTYFPLVHPSPLNFRWFNKNPWFELEVVPALQHYVQEALA